MRMKKFYSKAIRWIISGTFLLCTTLTLMAMTLMLFMFICLPLVPHIMVESMGCDPKWYWAYVLIIPTYLLIWRRIAKIVKE